MKKTILTLFVLASLVSCQQSKIAYIDNSVLINDCKEKNEIEEKFKLKEKEFTIKRDSVGKVFQTEYAVFQKEIKKLSTKKAQEKTNAINQKAQFLQQQLQVEQQQLRQAFQVEIDSLIIKVKSFVKDYGKTNGYNYILGTSDVAASVLYGEEKNNITQKVLEALNNQHKEK